MGLGGSEEELRIGERRFLVAAGGDPEGLAIAISRTGREILSLIKTEPNQEFLELLFGALEAAGLQWSEHK